MQRTRDILETLYYALPVQLVVIQMRYQKAMLACWLLLFLIVTGNFGSTLGIPFLLLEPEYNGVSDFFATFLVGCGMGTFIMAYMIASYITNGYRFDFLALERRPFFVFYLNNLLIPIAFVTLFSWNFIAFQSDMQGGFSWDQVGRLSGAWLGLLMVSLLIVLYFFTTNKSMVHVLGEQVVREMKGGRAILRKAKQGVKRKRRVDFYISGLFQVSVPDPDDKADLRQLVAILNQNHGNALFFQLLLLLVIMGIGLMENNSAFHLPAGTSVFLFFSIFLMVTGAITFWIRRFGPIAFAVLAVGYVVLMNLQVESNRHPAFGMDYEAPARPYDMANLRASSTDEMVKEDLDGVRLVLDRWKAKQGTPALGNRKPKAILVCTSGGGLRSAYFTVRVLQIADSMAGGGLLDRVRLITGASGGMTGAAYYRELFFRQQTGQLSEEGPIWNIRYAQPMCKDLLNRVSMKIATGLFLPVDKEEVLGKWYYADRGWSFDDQLARNLPVLKGRRLGDYTQAELTAVVPQMIFSPVIINDGRKLYVSAMPSSYLTRHFDYSADTLTTAVTGVDLMRFFAGHGASNLQFTTALRMNASFPFITPYVRMPSHPSMVLMDAGLADNYGLETTLRYLNHFGPWYVQNTDSVLLLQIRDSPASSLGVEEYTPSGWVSQLLDPIGGTYNAYYGTTDHMNEQYKYHMQRNLAGKMGYACFQYATPDTQSIRASLSWHLTPKEVEAIEATLKAPSNLAAFQSVADFLKP